MPLAPFAVPLATSDIVCDDAERSCAAPTSPPRGPAAARCEVRGARVLNICELAEQGPLVLGLARLAQRELPWTPSVGWRRWRADTRACASCWSPSGVACAKLRESRAHARLAIPRRLGPRRRSWPAFTAWPSAPTSPSPAGAGRVQGTLVGVQATSDGELERLTGAAVAASRP